MDIIRAAAQHFGGQFFDHGIEAGTDIRTTGVDDKGAVRFQFDHTVCLVDIRDP